MVELERTKAGNFFISDSVNLYSSSENNYPTKAQLEQKLKKVSHVLDDILVVDIDEALAKKVKCGQKILLNESYSNETLWLRYEGEILAIGSLDENNFRLKRVFNL